MKPIKLKELLRTAKDPATQRIVIDEGLWFDAPLFEGVVKDVDEALGERINNGDGSCFLTINRRNRKWRFLRS